MEPPSFDQWMQTISTWDLILLIVASFCAVVVIIIGFIEERFVSNYASDEITRHYLSWLVFMLPITAITSLVGMYFPSSGTFLNILGVCYLMICLTVIIRWMNYLFGSRIKIVQYMSEKNLKIDPNVFHCCHFLPKLKPTIDRIRFVERMVYQTSFVRILTGVTIMIAFLDHYKNISYVEDAVNGLNIASVLISAWGFEMLKKVGEHHLKPQRFSRFYNFVNLTHSIFTLQEVFSNISMKYGLFETGSLLTDEARSNYVASFFYCVEAFALSIVSIFVFSPAKNDMFKRSDPQKLNDEVEVAML